MTERYTLSEIREAIKQTEDRISRKRRFLLESIGNPDLVKLIEKELRYERVTIETLRAMANSLGIIRD